MLADGSVIQPGRSSETAVAEGTGTEVGSIKLVCFGVAVGATGCVAVEDGVVCGVVFIAVAVLVGNWVGVTEGSCMAVMVAAGKTASVDTEASSAFVQADKVAINRKMRNVCLAMLQS